MSTYRARSMCPTCSNEDEVWVYKGKIQPLSTIQCIRCSGLYDPSDFILCFVVLRQNVTVSSSTVVAQPNL